MGKRKKQPSLHTQEKCDVWLSTADKKEQAPAVKRQRVMLLRPICNSSTLSISSQPVKAGTKQTGIMQFFGRNRANNKENQDTGLPSQDKNHQIPLPKMRQITRTDVNADANSPKLRRRDNNAKRSELPMEGYTGRHEKVCAKEERVEFNKPSSTMHLEENFELNLQENQNYSEASILGMDFPSLRNRCNEKSNSNYRGQSPGSSALEEMSPLQPHGSGQSDIALTDSVPIPPVILPDTATEWSVHIDCRDVNPSSSWTSVTMDEDSEVTRSSLKTTKKCGDLSPAAARFHSEEPFVDSEQPGNDHLQFDSDTCMSMPQIVKLQSDTEGGWWLSENQRGDVRSQDSASQSERVSFPDGAKADDLDCSDSFSLPTPIVMESKGDGLTSPHPSTDRLHALTTSKLHPHDNSPDSFDLTPPLSLPPRVVIAEPSQMTKSWSRSDVCDDRTASQDFTMHPRFTSSVLPHQLQGYESSMLDSASQLSEPNKDADDVTFTMGTQGCLKVKRPKSKGQRAYRANTRDPASQLSQPSDQTDMDNDAFTMGSQACLKVEHSKRGDQRFYVKSRLDSMSQLSQPGEHVDADDDVTFTMGSQGCLKLKHPKHRAQIDHEMSTLDAASWLSQPNEQIGRDDDVTFTMGTQGCLKLKHPTHREQRHRNTSTTKSERRDQAPAAANHTEGLSEDFSELSDELKFTKSSQGCLKLKPSDSYRIKQEVSGFRLSLIEDDSLDTNVAGKPVSGHRDHPCNDWIDDVRKGTRIDRACASHASSRYELSQNTEDMPPIVLFDSSEQSSDECASLRPLTRKKTVAYMNLEDEAMSTSTILEVDDDEFSQTDEEY